MSKKKILNICIIFKFFFTNVFGKKYFLKILTLLEIIEFVSTLPRYYGSGLKKL